MNQKELSNEEHIALTDKPQKYAQSTTPNMRGQQRGREQPPKPSPLSQTHEQLQKLFQSLFSRQQLRKNLYFYQHLNPDMTLKSKVICQERKIAALTRDFGAVVDALRKCPLVEVEDTHGRAYGQETVKILTGGDLVILRLSTNNNNMNQLKKQLNPLLKDIKHQLKQQSPQSSSLQIEFQSQTSVTELLQRIKSKNLTPALQWQLIQKDPYECIKKSVKFLLKERKNQQYQYGGVGHGSYGYSGYGAYGGYGGYGAHGGYDQYYQYHQDSAEYTTNTTPVSAYTNMTPNIYTKSTVKYQTFIRKAVESDEQEQKHQDNKKYSVGQVSNRTNQSARQQHDQQSQQQAQSHQPKHHYKQKSEQPNINTNKSDKNYRNEGKSKANNRKHQKNNTHYEKNKNYSNGNNNSNGNSNKEPVIDDSQFPTL